MRAYVLGNENCVLGFSLEHVDGKFIRNGDELEAALNTCLADGTIGLLLVSADVAEWSRERIDRLKVSSLEPLVVEVPGEESEAALPSLAEFVQRAVGIRLGGS